MARVPSDRGWARLVRFLREVNQELVKVTWPTRREVITYSIVVVVTVVLVGAFVTILDSLFSRLITALVER